MSKTFSGSLSSKRKQELLDIASALELPDAAKSTAVELGKLIQEKLKESEEALKDSAMFKGLYKSARKSGGHENETEASPDLLTQASNTIASVAKKPRKSINKAIDRVQEVIDAANVPLPDSPMVSRISHAVDETASRALVPAKAASQDLIAQIKHLVRYDHSMEEFQHQVRSLQVYLSLPAHLLTASIGIELVFLLIHVTQWYNHTVYFPPPASSKGTFESLLHSLFFWFPKIAYTVRWPETRGVFDAHVWNAVLWWFATTVLPALAVSSIVSFVPQKGVHRPRGGARTRAVGPSLTPDPLTFSFVRFALLLWPLTTAAPRAMSDALEMSGNPQGRALGAGLTAALVVAHRLRGGL